MMQAAEPKIRHEWFQTDTHVTVSVFIKNLDPANVSMELAPRNLTLRIKSAASASTETVLDFDLLLAVVPAESAYEVLKTKVEVRLKKERVGIKWSALEGDGSEEPVKQDWSKVEKTVEEDKPEGEQALQALFQQIYRDASDDTRRAMMKSYIESNGTALSTNWEEVGAKRVEVTPPEGMIAKKFEY
ncbi:Cochaperone protein [Polyrhizophydium stewartii]|uniref:Cochaperone protein n=1 Tax=Polyrhizophydium stewartii TaxID=2732419 RepID=A0ABR4N2N6_9FUNG